MSRAVVLGASAAGLQAAAAIRARGLKVLVLDEGPGSASPVGEGRQQEREGAGQTAGSCPFSAGPHQQHLAAEAVEDPLAASAAGGLPPHGILKVSCSVQAVLPAPGKPGTWLITYRASSGKRHRLQAELVIVSLSAFNGPERQWVKGWDVFAGQHAFVYAGNRIDVNGSACNLVLMASGDAQGDVQSLRSFEPGLAGVTITVIVPHRVTLDGYQEAVHKLQGGVNKVNFEVRLIGGAVVEARPTCLSVQPSATQQQRNKDSLTAEPLSEVAGDDHSPQDAATEDLALITVPADAIVWSTTGCEEARRGLTFLDLKTRKAVGTESRRQQREGGLLLYRDMMAPGVRNLAFLEARASPGTQAQTEALQARWLAALAAGELQLPPEEAMRAAMAAQEQWEDMLQAVNTLPFKCMLPHGKDYRAQLLGDLGLPASPEPLPTSAPASPMHGGSKVTSAPAQQARTTPLTATATAAVPPAATSPSARTPVGRVDGRVANTHVENASAKGKQKHGGSSLLATLKQGLSACLQAPLACMRPPAGLRHSVPQRSASTASLRDNAANNGGGDANDDAAGRLPLPQTLSVPYLDCMIEERPHSFLRPLGLPSYTSVDFDRLTCASTMTPGAMSRRPSASGGSFTRLFTSHNSGPLRGSGSGAVSPHVQPSGPSGRALLFPPSVMSAGAGYGSYGGFTSYAPSIDEESAYHAQGVFVGGGISSGGGGHYYAAGGVGMGLEGALAVHDEDTLEASGRLSDAGGSSAHQSETLVRLSRLSRYSNSNMALRSPLHGVSPTPGQLYVAVTTTGARRNSNSTGQYTRHHSHQPLAKLRYTPPQSPLGAESPLNVGEQPSAVMISTQAAGGTTAKATGMGVFRRTPRKSISHGAFFPLRQHSGAGSVAEGSPPAMLHSKALGSPSAALRPYGSPPTGASGLVPSPNPSTSTPKHYYYPATDMVARAGSGHLNVAHLAHMRNPFGVSSHIQQVQQQQQVGPDSPVARRPSRRSARLPYRKSSTCNNLGGHSPGGTDSPSHLSRFHLHHDDREGPLFEGCAGGSLLDLGGVERAAPRNAEAVSYPELMSERLPGLKDSFATFCSRELPSSSLMAAAPAAGPGQGAADTPAEPSDPAVAEPAEKVTSYQRVLQLLGGTGLPSGSLAPSTKALVGKGGEERDEMAGANRLGSGVMAMELGPHALPPYPGGVGGDKPATVRLCSNAAAGVSATDRTSAPEWMGRLDAKELEPYGDRPHMAVFPQCSSISSNVASISPSSRDHDS